MRVPTKLYRSLLRLIRVANQQGIPVVGIAGLPAFPISCNARSTLRALFHGAYDDVGMRQGSSRRRLTEDDAFLALRLLRRQLQTLQAADDDTRQALSKWRVLLADRDRVARPMCPSGVLRGAEEGAMLVYRLFRNMDGSLFEDEDIGDAEEAVAKTASELDRFAQAARASRPHAFDEDNPSFPDRPVPASLREQLTAISETRVTTGRQALFSDRRLRCEPVEWVYDGVSPLLLPELLLKDWRDGAGGGRGVPLSVALVYCCVARRLRVPVRLFKASAAPASSTATGPVNLQGVPTEVAGRQAGRTVAAPSVDTWYVVAATQQPTIGASPPLPPPSAHTATHSDADNGGGGIGGNNGGSAGSGGIGGSSSSAAAAQALQPPATAMSTPDPDPASCLLLVEVESRRPGRVVTVDDVGARFPDAAEKLELLAAATPRDPHSSVATSEGLAGLGSRRHEEAELVGLLAELARAMVSAHQRRGESDLVAYWLYQVLALDPAAPEWQHVMHSEDVGS